MEEIRELSIRVFVSHEPSMTQRCGKGLERGKHHVLCVWGQGPSGKWETECLEGFQEKELSGAITEEGGMTRENY